jgi:hypothetical protein
MYRHGGEASLDWPLADAVLVLSWGLCLMLVGLLDCPTWHLRALPLSAGTVVQDGHAWLPVAFD